MPDSNTLSGYFRATTMLNRYLIFWLLAMICSANAATTPSLQEPPIVRTVAHDGSAGYRHIQAAIDSLPDNNRPAIIQIAAGAYEEKIYLTRNNITLMGAGADHTIIRYAQLRSHWLKHHPDDWGAAVVNIRGSDIALIGLTVHNTYGDIYQDNEHQFAIRGFEQATRIITADCRIIAGGADTLSLWNKTDGMYYHDSCYFEGHTDMVCPRGTAFFSNSIFMNKKTYATLWHDGELAEQQKLVVRDSVFEGITGFMLGRRHYDGQFYLINNRYSPNMADKPIWRHTYPTQPERDRDNRWGDRNYFNHTDTSQIIYPWMQNNLHTHPAQLQPAQITASWTFDHKWDPELLVKQLRKWQQELYK